MATNLAAANNNGQIMIGMGKRGPIEKARAEGQGMGEAVGQGEQKDGTLHCQGRGQTEERDSSPPSLSTFGPLRLSSLPCIRSYLTAISSRRLYDQGTVKRDKRRECWQYEPERLKEGEGHP